jgi:ribonuclease BN (tRNA processing enzyme)
MRILFLGSGGGRLNVVKQFFSTAGFVIDCSKRIYVDPGPGVAVQFRKFEKKFKLKIEDIDGIFASHIHLDHINDIEIVIEAMSDYARKKSGFLICDESVLGKKRRISDIIKLLTKKKKAEKKYEEMEMYEEIGEISPSISNYHKKLIEKICPIKAGKVVKIDNLIFEGTATKHDCPATGFVLEDKVEGSKIGYTSDTEFFEGIEKPYKGCDAIIINVLRVKNTWPGHFCIDDVIKFLNLTKPKYAILTRFGGQFLSANRTELKEKIERETKVSTIFSYDGMVFEM